MGDLDRVHCSEEHVCDKMGRWSPWAGEHDESSVVELSVVKLGHLGGHCNKLDDVVEEAMIDEYGAWEKEECQINS